MIELQRLLEAGKAGAQDTINGHRRRVWAFSALILCRIGKTIQDAIPVFLREQLVQIAQILLNAFGAAD
ncbi:MAG TPA: hypothetical protein DHV08_06430, partial [Rhodocyclaceae bacterium]|nr:hypothetical protein [Rhodocyclaceae bacterium]